MKFPYIDEYVADFEKFIRKAHYTIGNEATNQLFLKGLIRLVLINVMQYLTANTYEQMVQKAVESIRSQLTISNILQNTTRPHNNNNYRSQDSYVPRTPFNPQRNFQNSYSQN